MLGRGHRSTLIVLAVFPRVSSNAILKLNVVDGVQRIDVVQHLPYLFLGDCAQPNHQTAGHDVTSYITLVVLLGVERYIVHIYLLAVQVREKPVVGTPSGATIDKMDTVDPE